MVAAVKMMPVKFLSTASRLRPSMSSLSPTHIYPLSVLSSCLDSLNPFSLFFSALPHDARSASLSLILLRLLLQSSRTTRTARSGSSRRCRFTFIFSSFSTSLLNIGDQSQNDPFLPSLLSFPIERHTRDQRKKRARREPQQSKR